MHILLSALLCVGTLTAYAQNVKVSGQLVDAETGFEQYIDTGSRRLRQAHRQYWLNRQAMLQDAFNKSNVDNISISTDEDFVKSLLLLFKKRG